MSIAITTTDDRDRGTDSDDRPRQAAREHARRDRAHEVCLRCGQTFATDRERVVQQVEDRRHRDGGDDDTEDLHELLLPRRRADELTALEVLHVVATDRGRATHDAADQDRGDRSGRTLEPHAE
jgi:hypothetical protein